MELCCLVELAPRLPELSLLQQRGRVLDQQGRQLRTVTRGARGG